CVRQRPLVAELEDELAFEYAEGFVEGVGVQRGTGCARWHRALDHRDATLAVLAAQQHTRRCGFTQRLRRAHRITSLLGAGRSLVPPRLLPARGSATQPTS